MRTRLLLALLLPLCSAAPIDQDVDTEDDHVHDGSDNQREGNIFTHNQIGLGDIDVSGGVKGHDVSIGHQLEIDVHEHEVYAQEHSGRHAHGDNDHHVQGISTAETNKNIRAIEDFIATIQTIEDELNFLSDGRGNAATNNLSGDDRSFEVITQLINFFDESNMFGHEKKLFEIITRAIMHFYRVWHTQFRNPDFQEIMLLYRIWNTQFNNPGAHRSSRSSLQPSFAEIKSKLDAHEQATTNCRTDNCDAEKIKAFTKASKVHFDKIKNTGRVSTVFQQSFPILKKTVDSVAEKALDAEKAKLAKIPDSKETKNTITCLICEAVMKALDDTLVDTTNEKAVADFLSVICSYLGVLGGFMCIEFIREFTDDIIEMLVGQYLEPEKVCTTIMTCP